MSDNKEPANSSTVRPYSIEVPIQYTLTGRYINKSVQLNTSLPIKSVLSQLNVNIPNSMN